MAKGAEAPTFSIGEAFEILQTLGAERLEKFILVGGQAAAFWIARYNIAAAKLVTTKDIDLLLSGSTSAVVADCAKDLHGELLIVRDPRVPDVARIRTTMRGAELQIDFLRSLHGIKKSDVIGSKLPVPDERMRGKLLYVMHPVFALASRLFNTFELDGRLTKENLLRLQFSAQALRAYLMEELSAEEPAVSVDVFPSIEKIFGLAVSQSGLKAWRDYKIDVFSAVPNESELSKCSPSFLEKRHPQMLRALERRRTASDRVRPRSKPSATRK
jgi:hypothetical protein